MKTKKTSKFAGGVLAVKSGKIFEKQMIPIFEEAGYAVINASNEKSSSPEKRVVKNAPYITSYGTKGKTEYVIKNGKRAIRVEAKHQTSNGSVDEKFPYLWDNAVNSYPEKEVILVVDGGGYRAAARQWLQNAIDNNRDNYKEKGKVIKLMTMDEFASWCINEL